MGAYQVRKDILETDRLRLRPWEARDRPAFAAINADPRVMEYFPRCLTLEETDRAIAKIQAHFDRCGYGLWAVERRDRVSGNFIGFIGLQTVGFEADFTPAIEIGWRLAADHWGWGLATEGARAVVRAAFGELGLDRLVSFTAEINQRSWRVMEKLGMKHVGDFDHPALPEGDRLQRHRLYELKN